ncbi:hypothetical protein [Paenibacillus campinasensis]|uniref:Replicative helicase inhibitor G39P N-terminal domain-containing protein n=1 Tax=Paenibacillus campinasensis TaxID=66347 RepID=A0A268ELF1_9BACL|nr:hypothetical protein [Paenibacillus campinasensis]PAD73946.1 hypothetical protein CHH67_19115 [Paenibacillus campinasensis]
MKLITNVYQNFEVEDPAKIDVWYMVLRETSVESAKSNLMMHFRTSSFPPTPADLIGGKEPEKSLTIYDIQRKEQEQQLLELQEYHEREDVKPMPDHIAKRLGQIFAGMRVNRDES